MIPARVGRGNDNTNGFLIEAFKASMPLQVLQVTPDGPFGPEPFPLFARNQIRVKERLQTLRGHHPAFALGKRLAQKFEVRERRQGLNALALELGLQAVEIKARFQVMHSSLQKALPMQCHPEPNRAQPCRARKFNTREINCPLFRQKIYIRENHDSGHRMFKDLRAPTRFGSGKETLSFAKPEVKEKFYQIDKVAARRSKGMVIVIAPTQAQSVLAMLLNTRRVVPALPVSSFFLEEILAGAILADQVNDAL